MYHPKFICGPGLSTAQGERVTLRGDVAQQLAELLNLIDDLYEIDLAREEVRHGGVGGIDVSAGTLDLLSFSAFALSTDSRSKCLH